MSLNLRVDAVGELKTLAELKLSGTLIKEMLPPIWNLERSNLSLVINSEYSFVDK